MNKKSLIWGTVGVLLAWGGWLIYRNNRNNKIDKTITPYDEALKKLEKI
jgi:predicted negative regulator of RcsB-dependent stress response